MRQGRTHTAIALLLALTVSCASRQHGPTSAGKGKPPGLPPSPDVSAHVMGYLVLGDGPGMARELMRATGLPATESPTDVLEMLVSELLELDPRVVAAFDLQRPMAVALLNPSLLKGAAALPLIALVPVRERKQVEQAFAATNLRFTATDWGLVLEGRRGPLYLAFDGGYARLAFRPELVMAAQAVLGKVIEKPQGLLHVHLAVDNLHTYYGDRIDALVAQVTREGMRLDPKSRFATRNTRRMAHLAEDVRSLDATVVPEQGGLTFTVHVEGKPGERWSRQVAAQPTGPLWGVPLVPRDAVLVYATHRAQAAANSDIEEAISYIGDVASPPVPLGRRDAWREPLARAVGEMSGEVIYAVWPGESGGVGVGGAFRIRDAQAARRELLGAYRELGTDLGAVAARALRIDPRRCRVRAHVRGGATTLADVPIDTVEVSVVWPRDMAEEKRRFEELLGEQMVLGLAVVGDSALFTMGRDWEERLETMIMVAQGGSAASLTSEPAFRRALDDHPQGRVSLTYLPLGRMLRLLAGHPVVKDMNANAEDAIIFTTHASRTSYEMSTHLPPAALTGLLESGASLWRVALVPMMNPLVLPPLPGTIYPISPQ